MFQLMELLIFVVNLPISMGYSGDGVVGTYHGLEVENYVINDITFT